MAYPFDENPFEDYFQSLRALRWEELVAYGHHIDEELAPEDRREWATKFNEVRAKVSLLIADNKIDARSFDVYLGEIDLALEIFEQEFPRPREPSQCSHPEKGVRLRYHANNTSHVVTQCAICGRVIKDHKKSQFPNWTNLPPFENGTRRKEDVEYSRWWEARNEVVKNLVGEDGRYPKFSYEEFAATYEEDYPKPLSPHECKHERTQLVLRRYSVKNIAVATQCISCGKHVQTIPKKTVKNLASLPEFHVEMEDSAWANLSKWHEDFHRRAKEARSAFDEELLRKIRSGEVTRVNKTTFGSYYGSAEWTRTRERILLRDNHECQACGYQAECVHHLTYERLGRENDFDLMSLCQSCHECVHKYQDEKWLGFKLTPKEIKSYVFGNRSQARRK